MAKNVPPHQHQQAAKCIFCQKPGLSKTHIWPEWLNKFVSPRKAKIIHIETPDHRVGPDQPKYKSRKTEGSIFSQKPYLACVDCNIGWMKVYEDEMAAFAKPIFAPFGEISLSVRQMKILAGWAALIAILAEFIDKTEPPVISFTARKYLKNYSIPPSNWTIIAASIYGNDWSAKYRHHKLGIFTSASREELRSLAMSKPKSNTLISSFGMGNLFIQVFVCHDERHIEDFRATAKTSGAVQIWPIPWALWPFAKRRAHFPTKLELTDEAGDIFADAFRERLRLTTFDADRL